MKDKKGLAALVFGGFLLLAGPCLSWAKAPEAFLEPQEEEPPLFQEEGGFQVVELEEEAGTFPEEEGEGERTEVLPELPKESGFPQESGGGSLEGDVKEAELPKEEVLHQPKLVLEGYEPAGAALEAGKECSLTFTFRNMSRDRGIYNLKISAAAEGEGLFLEKSSFYYEGVKAREAVSVPLVLRPSAGFSQGTAKVVFQMEYEDDRGTACTAAEQESLPVNRPLQLTLSPLSLPGQVYALETVQGEVAVQNVGKAEAYNLRAVAEGEGLAAGEVYLGNLKAGEEVRKPVKVYVKAQEDAGKGSTGEISGRLALTYEDEGGGVHTQEQSFSLQVLEPQVFELKAEEPEEETNQWWISLLALTIVLLLLTAAGLLVLLRRSRRQFLEAFCREEERKAKEGAENERKG